MPISSLARVRPSSPAWLNDVSSKPPASETMQPLKAAAVAADVSPSAVAVAAGSLSEAVPQAATARAVALASTAARASLLTSPLLGCRHALVVAAPWSSPRLCRQDLRPDRPFARFG